MRHEYKTLAHPEQDLNKQNAPCESGNLPIASKSARALLTRRSRRSSHHSGVPMAAPSSLKLAVLFQLHPGKQSCPKDCEEVQGGDDFSLAQVDC